jgi:signal transduction histidine kinase/ligand-binding sensor domain-containing protein/DNA-binding response OmpR family regulator
MLIRYNKISVLFFYALWFFSNTLFGQGIAFKHITVENGLSNNKVNCVLEDKAGFIWFGTDDGLNRFDGYDIKIYRNRHDDKNSISSNGIWTIFEDEDGFLWIGTKAGELNRYNPQLDKFEYWKVESDKTNENSITSVYVDKQKSVWIGTYKNGLYKFDVHKNKFTNWQYKPDDPSSISNNYITSITEDYNHNIWISTYNGINKFNPSRSDNYFTRYYHNQKDINSISNNLIWNIVPSKTNSDIFWICTANGLSYYDSKKSEFSQIVFPAEKQLQFGNSISSIIEEDSGTEKIYWLGSYAGLIRLDLKNNSIQRFLSKEDNLFSLSSDQINKMIKDRSGVIWIATENGVSYFSRKESRFNNYLSAMSSPLFFNKLKKTNTTSICKNGNGITLVGSSEGLLMYDAKNQKGKFFPDVNVWTLTLADENNVWIGTYGQGLKKLDLKTNTIKQIEIKSDIILPSFYRYIKSILQDKDGIVWIGFWGSGLVRYNPAKSEFKTWINHVNDKFSLSYNDVWSIIEDKFANIWIGTNGGGLNLYEKSSGKFIRLSSNPESKNSLNSNTIYTLYESKNSRAGVDQYKNIIWIGTSNGLNKLIFDTDLITKDKNLNVTIKSYTTENGLPDNSVKSITEDDNGNLWIGTSNGLSQFNPETEKFINYSAADGLNGNDFHSSALLKNEDGSILMGSSKGLNFFNPKEIKQSGYHPPVMITDFLLFNKSVSVGKDSPLKENILFTKEILLSHDQNIFSFQFTALDFNSPQSIHYAYKMAGLDGDWNYSGTRRYAAYTNLAPGIYYFLVKATNSDGVWNENYSSIKVVINQPWWKTGWAYLLYFMIIGLGLIGIRRFEINRTELRNELKMREFEAQKLKEVEKVKTRFFANLSHEFRTPLMLIKGPIEQLKDGIANGNILSYYDMIYRNTEKLHTLIDQLLELTQLEAESIPVKARKENIVPILRGIFFSFRSIADQKNIALDFLSNDSSICAWVDRDKLEKVINNLLSNALKFTSEGGLISLDIVKYDETENNFANIKIADTGIGIPEEKLNQIFDRFYQVDDSSGRNYGGSGIGLSLVKELVDLHKWDIEVQSKSGKGTTFILTIPLNDSYLADNQKAAEEKIETQNKKQELTSAISLDETNVNLNSGFLIQEDTVNKLPTILVVEDSKDVREYIFSLLHNDYEIIHTEDAEAGMIKATELMPDLILSDIMMPGTDGLEFCRQIKTNFQTSHIPIILLTAKVSQENKIEGLETGADDYVTKPFNFKELSTRIKNLIDQRKKLKEKFSKEIKFEPEAVTVNSLDKEFLAKALDIAEKNIYNLDFDVDLLAKEMFLSRSQLHRKMVAVTGQAPGEFIRVFRLKKAAQLILQKKLSVTQIALEVGFNSPSHFTKAFQQYFNCLPSEFVVQNNHK